MFFLFFVKYLIVKTIDAVNIMRLKTINNPLRILISLSKYSPNNDDLIAKAGKL